MIWRSICGKTLLAHLFGYSRQIVVAVQPESAKKQNDRMMIPADYRITGTDIHITLTKEGLTYSR